MIAAAVRIRRMDSLPQVDVRVDLGDRALADRLALVSTAPWPTTPDTAAAGADGQGHVLWLGPDEWLVVGPEGGGDETAPALETALRDAAGPAWITTVDVTGNRVGIEVTGPQARELLAFGCSIDLHPARFGPGRCAQTLVARAGVVLWCLGPEAAPVIRLLVRPSFADYLEAWLGDASEGLG